MIEAQIPETYLLSAITFQTLIATKAARCVGGGRRAAPVVEFGTRRAHTPEAGVLGARAAYIGGCAGTSNTLAGFRYGIPVMGTAAHSWVMAFPARWRPSASCRRVLGEPPCSCSIPTTRWKARAAPRSSAARCGACGWTAAISIALSRQVRGDSGRGRPAATPRSWRAAIWTSTRIRDLVRAGAPIDAFGVGTQLATSADAPTMGAIYKLVELEICGIKRFTAKYSEDKGSLPGAKQVFRDVARDVIARSGECGKGEALLRPDPAGRPADRTAARRSSRRARAPRNRSRSCPEPLRAIGSRRSRGR